MKGARVALSRGDTRRETVAAALESVAQQIRLDGARYVLVKPNFVSVTNPAAVTHVDAVRAVLDHVRAHYDGPVLVAEGAATAPTWTGFCNHGYKALIDAYGVELVDLNADEAVPVQVYDRRLRPMTLHLARSVVEADYRISVGLPKTHDCVIATLSIKNMVMGTLVNRSAVRDGGGAPGIARRVAQLVPRRVRQSGLAEWSKGTLFGGSGGSNKLAMHQGRPVINLNLALIAPRVWPHLAVIDGWHGMEGPGPSAGRRVEWGVALAGTDPLAVDVLTAHLMGFDPELIGYLQYCRLLRLGVGDVASIGVVGGVEPDQVRRSFAPHPTHRRQLDWHLAGADEILRSWGLHPPSA